VRQTALASLADKLGQRHKALTTAYHALRELSADLRPIRRSAIRGEDISDQIFLLVDRFHVLAFQLEGERLMFRALYRFARENATSSQLRYCRHLEGHLRLVMTYASLLSSQISITYFFSLRALVNTIIEQERILESLRSANERQRMEFLQDLKAQQTIVREPSIYDHWRRESGDLDIAALFEGTNEPELLRELDRRLKKHEERVVHMSGLSPGSLLSPLGWGLDAIERSYRGSLRSAYADEAPAEGLRRASGTRLSRHRAYDLETGEEIDVLDLLPAGEPGGISPEAILIRKEEEEFAHREIQHIEAAFRAEMDSLRLSGKQQEVLLDCFFHAPRNGYDLGHRNDSSMRRFWGDSYGAKRRMRQRLQKQYPAFFNRWRRRLLGMDSSEPD